MNVNLSADHLASTGLIDDVRRALKHSGLRPALLTVEVVEAALVSEATVNFEMLRALGVGISIDDFGTGYSSIVRVAELPVTELKADRGLLIGHGNDKMLTAVAQLGGSLGLRLVAEGIETEDQLELVRKLGFDEAQGYLLGRPISALEVRRGQRPWAEARPTLVANAVTFQSRTMTQEGVDQQVAGSDHGRITERRPRRTGVRPLRPRDRRS